MIIVVNDANLLIDLVELELLPQFFALEFQFFTTSLVFEELDDDQQHALNSYVELGALTVSEITLDQLTEINNIQKKRPTLSLQDCSAFYQAAIKKGILITSDNTLRKFAKDMNQEVHGHLWVLDRMVEFETISGKLASVKLNELCEVVNRKLGLPLEECQRHIKKWTS